MKSVLVVDDFGTVRMLQRQALAEIGVSDVSEAADGVEAVEAIKAKRFDLVITDWNMPRLGGLDLLRAIRSASKTLPVLMVTSKDRRDEVQQAADHGVSGYIVKPFDRGHYQTTVARLLRPRAAATPAGVAAAAQ